MNVLMLDQEQEKHQLAGFDARERGFSRPVVFEQVDGGYRAMLQYETTRVVTVAQATPGAALEELIRTLQGQGYSQLRSQLSVREGTYLGSQEPWIEYPDPAKQLETPDGLIGKFFSWFSRSTSS
jgi:predicted component of type VI protein secretion system